MSHTRVALAAVALATVFAVAACSGVAEPAAPASAPPTIAPTTPSTPYASAAPLSEKIDFANQLENFDPAQFTNPTKIDNTWYPLKPGTRFVYEGVTEETPGTVVPHRLVFTVTDLTKVVNGVRSVVIWAEDFTSGQLAETELAFRAQDNAGNVWHTGEYPEVYQEGQFVEATPWIPGIDGARAGIVVKKEPELGGPSYSQGWSPTIPWTDRARVSEVGVKNCVKAGCYENVIVVEEFSREEPNAFQLKYYAPGIGDVRVGFRGADPTKESLELVSVTQLAPDALAAARGSALELEKRAYVRSKNVYGRTPPAEPAA